MLVAEVQIVGSIDLELRALDWLYRTWLPEGGHVPGPQPCLEAWAGEPFAHGDAHFELRLQLPIAARAAPVTPRQSARGHRAARPRTSPRAIPTPRRCPDQPVACPHAIDPLTGTRR